MAVFMFWECRNPTIWSETFPAGKTRGAVSIS